MPVKYETGVGYLDPERISASGIAELLAAPVSAAARGSAGAIRARVGTVAWLALWPAWRAGTSATVVYWLIYVAIQVAVAVFVPALAPFLRPLIDLIRAILAGGSPPFADLATVTPKPSVIAGLLDRLAFEVWKLRGDPRTSLALDAVERLLFPTDDPDPDFADAVRAGVASCQPWTGGPP